MARPAPDPILTKQALRRAVRATRRARSGSIGPAPDTAPARIAKDLSVIGRPILRDPPEGSGAAGSGAAIAGIALRQVPIRQATCVAVYASLPDEPDTAPLRQALRELGIRVLLPVVPAVPSGPTDPADRGLEWALDGGPLIAGGPLALPEPQGELLGAAALGEADVVIVPALAVDTNGTRLGRGKGHYDAALRHASPSALVIALIHDDELLDAATTPIPREPHDLPAHAVITPTRALFFTARSPRG